MLLEIPVPERCEECERLEAEFRYIHELHWWAYHEKASLEYEVEYEASKSEGIAHRRACRVWLAAHGT